MHILLLILKITGIILLVLLGLLVLLILAVLFVPVRYEAKGHYLEKKPWLQAKVTFAFPLLLVRAFFDEKPDFYVRILGIKLKERGAKAGKKAEKKRPQKKRTKPKKKSPKEDAQTFRSLTEREETAKAEGALADPETAAHDRAADEAGDGTADAAGGGTEKKRKVSPGELAEAVREKCRTLVRKCRDAKDSAEKKKALVAEYLDFFQKDDTKRAFSLAKNTLLKLLGRIRPRKLSVRLHFGTGDPASCGQICGFAGMLYPFIGKYVTIEPDMENSIFEGEFYVRGRIFGVSLLKAGLVFLLHKDMKCLRDMVMKK